MPTSTPRRSSSSSCARLSPKRSIALRSRWRGLATSTITGIELRRASGRAQASGRESVADDEAVAVLLDVVAEIPLTGRVRATAEVLEPIELRTLDAIHLASALALGDDLGEVVTYDHRMTAAAAAIGLRVSAPR